jgi:YD repeat-containing protein
LLLLILHRRKVHFKYLYVLYPGQAVNTTYTYDDAHQLASAQEGSGTAWQYHYDGNGSLVEMTPGEHAANGARRYSYNTAGQLKKVECHNGTGYQPQAEMAYNGQGQRLSLTTHQDWQSHCQERWFFGLDTWPAAYLLDGKRVLVATALVGHTSYYLPGVGEYQADWRYYLLDGLGSVRQVTDEQGQVTFARSFTPWSVLLAQSGVCDVSFGYRGGLLEAVIGLIYIDR